MQTTTYRPSYLSPFSCDKANPVLRRTRLVRLTRAAFLKWGEASALYQERKTDLRPSWACIEEARLLCEHRERRFNLLQSRLASECGLPMFSVYNDISQAWPVVPRLMQNI